MIRSSLASPGIVIVNYNCLSLALEAVESVFKAEQLSSKARVVLVNNGSTTHSFEDLETAVKNRFQQTVASGKQDGRRVKFDGESITSAKLVLIDAESNEGFASGCNIGLQFLHETDTDHFLLLNPDAVLHPGALKAFAAKLSSDKRYGLVGATLLNAAEPYATQACGGACFSGLTLLGKNLGAGLVPDKLPHEREIEKIISYPVGAAMAFRRDWLEYAGFLDERYFLYYEEIDWVKKGSDRYKTGWAKSAVVYHHHGAVAGSKVAAKERSSLADYHMIRSRRLFSVKWCPWLLPVISGLSLVQASRRVLRGQKEQARAILRASLPNAARRFS